MTNVKNDIKNRLTNALLYLEFAKCATRSDAVRLNLGAAETLIKKVLDIVEEKVGVDILDKKSSGNVNG